MDGVGSTSMKNKYTLTSKGEKRDNTPQIFQNGGGDF
jgi:hypothetical protein